MCVCVRVCVVCIYTCYASINLSLCEMVRHSLLLAGSNLKLSANLAL